MLCRLRATRWREARTRFCAFGRQGGGLQGAPGERSPGGRGVAVGPGREVGYRQFPALLADRSRRGVTRVPHGGVFAGCRQSPNRAFLPPASGGLQERLGLLHDHRGEQPPTPVAELLEARIRFPPNPSPARHAQAVDLLQERGRAHWLPIGTGPVFFRRVLFALAFDAGGGRSPYLATARGSKRVEAHALVPRRLEVP